MNLPPAVKLRRLFFSCVCSLKVKRICSCIARFSMNACLSLQVIAIVMDMITDPQILQDLLDAASRRLVPVYILLDEQGVPHFLDMCSRLKIGSEHLRVGQRPHTRGRVWVCLEECLYVDSHPLGLQKIRTRTLQGVGFNLSFGRLPGSLCYKYMLVDGDKVMFGSYRWVSIKKPSI